MNMEANPVAIADYIPIRHRPAVGEEDVGRLSAQAVLAQYEIAAKAVESMGEEIRTRLGRLEAALAEADEDMKLVAEAAKSIREKGSLVYAQIEEASGLSKDIRATCAEFRRKIGA
jgi:predicted ribosome quality control (RQC) complex YloA/Tae2 family protein